MSMAVSTVNDIGSPQHRSAVVAIGSTPVKVTVSVDYKTMEIFNESTSAKVYYGGSGVTDVLGIPLFPEGLKVFHGLQNRAEIYFVCSSGESTNLRIVEYP